MSLFQRKPRPLARDAATYRDDRLFIIACDDTFAPKQYFATLKLPRIQIHVVETTDGTSVATHVLKRLLEYEYGDDDERWLLLDTDHCTQGNHLQAFLRALKDAEKQGIHVALSKPCFDLWLLLHHVEPSLVKNFGNCNAVESAIRSELGQYNKTRVDPMKFPPESLVRAHSRAKELDLEVAGGEIPAGNTTRVYRLIDSILMTVPSWQRPKGFPEQ
jgi:hypothetical protein